MKRRLAPGTTLAAVLILVLFVPAIGFSQTPTSGALLTIDGTAGSTPVHQKIYDSQIHTTIVRTVPVGGDSACSSADQIPTDAYVLQGGAPTGCDPGDAFETTQGAGTASITGTGYSFSITTAYCTTTPGPGQTSCQNVGTGTGCDFGGICANPDTGFLTVTNLSGTPFSGTITLKGIAVNPAPINPAECPPGGVASESFVAGLANGASATLALSTDSSNCGGFNQGQTQTLVAGQTAIFPFGNVDDYQITPVNSALNDTMTITPIPVPAGYTMTLPSSFDPGINFPGKECVAYKDFSAIGNPVCVEIQRDCVGTDSCGFLYTAQLDFSIDANSIPNGIGGPFFMGQHAVNCPTNGFDLNILISYTGAPIDPIKGGGAGGASCFVAAFDPNAQPIGTGTTLSTFVGLQSPVQQPPKLTLVKPGSAVPLTWQQFDSTGNPVTNLSLCPTVDNPDGTCNNQPPPPVSPPWVSIGTIPIDCTTEIPFAGAKETSAAGGSSLQNFGDGTYRFSLKTQKNATGCVAVIFEYDSGVFLVTADIKFKK